MFFMSQYYLLNAEFSPRTVMAILFFALAFMPLFHNGITNIQKNILFIIFTASCVVSHYSTTYILLIVLILTWIVMQIIPWITKKRRPIKQYSKEINNNERNGLSLTRSQPQYHITLGLITFIFCIIFLWYSQVTSTAFSSGVNFIATSVSSLKNFFDMSSRGQGAEIFGSGLGSESIPAKIYFSLTWITILFIAVGIISILFSYRHDITIHSDYEDKSSQYLIQKLDVEFFILSFVCSIVLTMAVILPYVFVGYDMTRTYTQMMTILSPFFVLGGIKITNLFRKKLSSAIILLVLIPYFLSATGFTYQIFHGPPSIILNSEGQDYEVRFVHEQESFCARWLGTYNLNVENIYSDWFGIVKLISQGNIPSSIYAQSFIENGQLTVDGYFYLPYTGVVDNKLLDHNYNWHNITNYPYEFQDKDLIYSNGGSQVWY